MGQFHKQLVEDLIVYVIAFIFTFIALSLLDMSNNKYLLAAIFSLFVLILFLFISRFRMNDGEASSSDGEGLFRHTMLCKSCNWEWMSNTTDNKKPSKCPNCGEKRRLDLVGWRKIKKYQDIKNQELNKFLKK
ncbi:MAG: hypothetical protein ABIH25_00110 [Candidatus Woesearchaeota archaeon]